jgi:hypothetical protein
LSDYSNSGIYISVIPGIVLSTETSVGKRLYIALGRYENKYMILSVRGTTVGTGSIYSRYNLLEWSVEEASAHPG